MIKTNPLSVKKITQIAKEIRAKYHIDFDSYFPIFEVLEKLMYNDKLTLQIVEDNVWFMNRNIPAIYNSFENYIYIKESVLEEYESGNYRSSFTLCHEFFHYLQAQCFHFYFQECEFCKSYEEIDWQANEFAGQLLIPNEFLQMNEENLSKQFHVSIECALTRKVKKKRRNYFPMCYAK